MQDEAWTLCSPIKFFHTNLVIGFFWTFVCAFMLDQEGAIPKLPPQCWELDNVLVYWSTKSFFHWNQRVKPNIWKTPPHHNSPPIKLHTKEGTCQDRSSELLLPDGFLGVKQICYFYYLFCTLTFNPEHVYFGPVAFYRAQNNEKICDKKSYLMEHKLYTLLCYIIYLITTFLLYYFYFSCISNNVI